MIMGTVIGIDEHLKTTELLVNNDDIVTVKKTGLPYGEYVAVGEEKVVRPPRFEGENYE